MIVDQSVSNSKKSSDRLPVPQLEEGDALLGAAEIHDYLCQLLGRQQSLANTYWQLRSGVVPAHKFGRLYLASRRGLAQHFARGTGLVA